MPGRTEKVPAPPVGRGRRRFEPTAEPDRKVLPERPRREVDHEIVADLLGGDPARLTVVEPTEPARLPATVPVRPERPAKIEAAASVASPLQSIPLGEASFAPGFQSFVDRWRHALRKGQIRMCEVLFQKTYALGRTDCETSFSELASLTGLTMRQCFNIMSQLEALKFIERQPTVGGGNRKGQGSRIIFYLFPKN